MNILLLSTHLNIGGVASYIVNIALGLKRRGHEVTVSSSGGDMVGELTKNGISHVILDIRTKSEASPKLLASMPRLLRLIREKDIDIIHAHTRVTQVMAYLASKISKVPYITTCHGFFRPHFTRRVFKFWGAKTIAISNAVRQHLIKDFKVPVKDVSLIYNGIDIDRFSSVPSGAKRASLRKKFGLKDGHVIGAVGRLSPVKGYSFLIGAFRVLLERYSGLQLLIVGDGPEEGNLKDLCVRFGINDKVRFVKADKNIPEILSLVDIFVSSAVQEGLGLSLVEALAARRPVVASNVGGVTSVVRDDITGLLVKPRDSLALAEGISRLLEDSSLRERLGAEGRLWAEKAFNLEVMVEKIEKLMAETSRRSQLPRNILIVNVNWLGDVLFTTPFIKALRQRYPESHIACMLMPRCKDIVDDNIRLNEVIIYDEDNAHRSLIGKLKLIRQLRKKRFDTAYILHRSFTRAAIAALSGIPKRIGYNTKKRGLLLTGIVDDLGPGAHKVEYFLNILTGRGAGDCDKDYEFFVNKSHAGRIETLLRQMGIEKKDTLVAINPGGNWIPKRWPKERYAELSDRLFKELGAKTVITGTEKESALARDIAELSQYGKPVDLCGKTTIKELAALLERSDLVVSSDSGPMHLALAVKTKVITLFGPTSDALTGPYGSGDYTVIKKDIECQVPCYNFGCKDHTCMKKITVNEVFEKVRELL